MNVLIFFFFFYSFFYIIENKRYFSAMVLSVNPSFELRFLSREQLEFKTISIAIVLVINRALDHMIGGRAPRLPGLGVPLALNRF